MKTTNIYEQSQEPVSVSICAASDLTVVCVLQDTTVLLRRAFSAPGSRPINIFGVAAALAEGKHKPQVYKLPEGLP